VTGASGFLGGHFIRAALESHDVFVHGVVRPSSKVDADVSSHPRFYSVLSDRESLRKAFSNQKFDVVLHLATEYGRGATSVSTVLEANLALPVAILDLCREFDCKAFINIDSYFNKPDSTYSHLSNYSLSKKSLVNWFPFYSETVTILNVVLEHVYGPGDSEQKFLPSMIREIVSKQSATVEATSGYQKRDFVHVDDVVSALLCLTRRLRDFPNTTDRLTQVPLGSGVTTSIRELCDRIISLSNSPSRMLYGSLPSRIDEIPTSVADIDYLRRLGWAPKIDLVTGLKRLIELAGRQ
jgi:nucleoside-diphosphate-sugar epimerase